MGGGRNKDWRGASMSVCVCVWKTDARRVSEGVSRGVGMVRGEK